MIIVVIVILPQLGLRCTLLSSCRLPSPTVFQCVSSRYVPSLTLSVSNCLPVVKYIAIFPPLSLYLSNPPLLVFQWDISRYPLSNPPLLVFQWDISRYPSLTLPSRCSSGISRGIPGVPGSPDLRAALHRLGPGQLGAAKLGSDGMRTPESIMSLGSSRGSLGGSLGSMGSSAGSCWKLPEKLQVRY